MIYRVRNARLRENKDNFLEDDLWQVMNEVKEEVIEDKARDGFYYYGTKFDISCDNGVINRKEELDDFGFNYLKHRADEIRQIIKDIHQCLEKQDSTHIDLFFSEGVTVLLSTNGEIDNALYYRYHEEVGKDKKGYRKITYRFRGNDLSNPLQIALEFDYIIHKKTNYVWDVSMENGLEQLLKDCIPENKNVNFTYNDLKTDAELEAERRAKEELEEQERLRYELENRERLQYEQMMQMMEQMELQRQQMLAFMQIYQQKKSNEQVEEFEEDFEDVEDFDDVYDEEE